jgi:hypothetical protein
MKKRIIEREREIKEMKTQQEKRQNQNRKGERGRTMKEEKIGEKRRI